MLPILHRLRPDFRQRLVEGDQRKFASDSFLLLEHHYPVAAISGIKQHFFDPARVPERLPASNGEHPVQYR